MTIRPWRFYCVLNFCFGEMKVSWLVSCSSICPKKISVSWESSFCCTASSWQTNMGQERHSSLPILFVKRLILHKIIHWRMFLFQTSLEFPDRDVLILQWTCNSCWNVTFVLICGRSQSMSKCCFPGMFDRDNNGTITFNEFSSLWKYITDWQNTFRSYDKDNSGTIDKRELQTGVNQFYWT